MQKMKRCVTTSVITPSFENLDCLRHVQKIINRFHNCENEEEGQMCPKQCNVCGLTPKKFRSKSRCVKAQNLSQFINSNNFRFI